MVQVEAELTGLLACALMNVVVRGLSFPAQTRIPIGGMGKGGRAVESGLLLKSSVSLIGQLSDSDRLF
jgi:hypothetical protein